MTATVFNAINWNRIEDPKDLEVWDRLTGNFWLPEKVPLSNDIQSWDSLTDAERELTMRVFAGLTLLDTIQGTVGAISLIPDAFTPHEEAVYTNIAFMERFGESTELLTPQGWKSVAKITADDMVMQYDPEDNSMSFVKPTKVFDPEWRDEMYEIAANNGNARQVVSGLHRVYVEEKKLKRNDCHEWTYSTYEARDLLSVNLGTSHRRFRSTGEVGDGAGMSAVDRLKVAISADGSFKVGSTPRCTGAITGTIPCMFTFAKARKIDRLRELAEEAGWELRERSHVRKDGQRTFVLSVPLEHVGNRSKRFADWWSLDVLSLTWCREFVAELGLWDGHTLKGGGGVTFYTTDVDNSDFVVAASAMAGYRSRTVVREDGRSESYSDSYVTNITTGRCTVGAQSMKITPAEPQITYCVQVPSTFLLTRNGESTVITGNCVHAKSYSQIFSTLATTKQIDEAFAWSATNEHLQRKAKIVLDYYEGNDPLKRKVASTLLEGFLFYSGFYLPMYMASRGKLTNTADILRLIIRDEAVHGYYIGYKYQRGLSNESGWRVDEMQDYTFDLLSELYENEVEYTQSLYDGVGLTEDVKKFLRYNANKALMNLGYDGLFPKDECEVNPAILSALSPDGNENHDFFSGSGSTYVMGKAECTEDEDWTF